MSCKKSDDEIKEYFLANFVECDDPERLWIGEIISTGEDSQSLGLKETDINLPL